MEKPTMKQRLNGVLNFLYDSNTGQVLGRGAKSWAEISVFYIIYYACLTGFFAATLAVFYETVPNDEPKLQSDSSLLMGNPGLGFRPMSDVTSNKIDVATGTSKNTKHVDSLNEYLKTYEQTLKNTDCVGIVEPRPKEDVACAVNYAKLTAQCNSANDYGMADGKPCVLIKLNKVYGWTPKLWDTADDAPKAVVDGYQSDVVPISCTTKKSEDADKLGDVTYYPQQGYPVAFFPYRKQEDYRSPLVFVQFPNMTRGKSFEIECRAYAKNIEYDRVDMQGSVQFKLSVD